MKKLMTITLTLCLMVFASGCLDVIDAPIPPECPLFWGELKSAVGHSYSQEVKPDGDSFMKPRKFYIVDDSRVYMYTYSDFANANPELKTKFELAQAALSLNYDLEKAFVLRFDMHVTTAHLYKANRTHYNHTLYFIVGTIQNDEVDKVARVERFKIQGIGGSFYNFYAYQEPRDNALVQAPWVSITGEGKIKYDRKTHEPNYMYLKGTINGVIPGQVVFEFPFQTKLCDC